MNIEEAKTVLEIPAFYKGQCHFCHSPENQGHYPFCDVVTAQAVVKDNEPKLLTYVDLQSNFEMTLMQEQDVPNAIVVLCSQMEGQSFSLKQVSESFRALCDVLESFDERPVCSFFCPGPGLVSVAVAHLSVKQKSVVCAVFGVPDGSI